MPQGSSLSHRGGWGGGCLFTMSQPLISCLSTQIWTPQLYFWGCHGGGWRGRHTPYPPCGGAWGRPLSQTRLWSIEWVCRSVIGCALIKYILQAPKYKLSDQWPSAPGLLLACEDFQKRVTRPWTSPIIPPVSLPGLGTELTGVRVWGNLSDQKKERFKEQLYDTSIACRYLYGQIINPWIYHSSLLVRNKSFV